THSSSLNTLRPNILYTTSVIGILQSCPEQFACFLHDDSGLVNHVLRPIGVFLLSPAKLHHYVGYYCFHPCRILSFCFSFLSSGFNSRNVYSASDIAFSMSAISSSSPISCSSIAPQLSHITVFGYHFLLA